MHFSCVVGVPARSNDTHQSVEAALAPFFFDDPDADNNAFWDWWSIGGRWTGYFEPGYEPAADPRNFETCTLCEGTGTRDWSECVHVTPEWIERCNGCNGCDGTGRSLKWPTRWAPRDLDRVSHDQAVRFFDRDDAELPYRIVIGEQVIASEEFNGEAFVKTPNWRDVVLNAVNLHRGCDFVIVDYHS
jgi:hypothetical protein